MLPVWHSMRLFLSAHLVKMEQEIKNLCQEVASLRNDVGELKRVCSRMDEHITFINSTYDTVRSPMSWALSRINRMIGVGAVELPQIKDKESE